MTQEQQTMFNDFCSYLDEQQLNMLKDWETLVNLEGRADEKEALEKTAVFLKKSFAGAGLTCRFLDAGPASAPFLVGTNRAPSDNRPPVLFTGHYDTVFASGSRGPNPFYIESGKAYGPGVLDMKGGIIVALYILKALPRFNLDIPVKIAFCGDEENGHVDSCSAELLQQQAKECLFAFNMETGFEHKALCTSRKGCVDYEISVTGVSSHPGNAFANGRNAIEEMACKVLALQKITAEDLSYTVSVNTINGGTSGNIIPDSCSCFVDVRGVTLAAIETAIQKIEEVCAKTTVEGTSTAYRQLTYMPPFERTEPVARLIDFVQQCAVRYQLHVPDEVALGGSSDASYIGAADIPILCSCGVCGALSHTEKEYALTGSMAERAKLYFAALLERDRF